MTSTITENYRTEAAAEPRARFVDLVAAEWLKLWSLRSTIWALPLSALAIIVLSMGTAYNDYKYWFQRVPSDRAGFIPHGFALLDAFSMNAALILILVTGTIGALAITGEYSTGLIRTTFAAVPARRSVLAAKACVVAAVTALFGAVVAGVSFYATQAILSGRHAGVSIGHPGALRVVLASALLAPVCGLTGLALGTVIRHSAAAVVSGVVLLMVLPIIMTDGQYLPAVIGHATPFRAWVRLIDINYSATGPFPPTAYTWTITGAWIVYAAWALVATAVAVIAVHRRDQ